MFRLRSERVAPTSDVTLISHGRGNFSISGSVDFDNANRLLTDGQAQFAAYRAIKINLANASCANTTGLALLLEWSTSCRAIGKNIVYERPQQSLVDLARINDVERLLCFANQNTGNLLRATGN